MPEKYTPLEKYLRELPVSQEEVTLTFERIEQILNEPLPPQAFENGPWWGNQRQGCTWKSVPGWMQAGWWKLSISGRSGSVLYVSK